MTPGYGVVSYNGYTFPATYRMSLSSEPVYVPNTGNLMYYANTLQIEFIISAPDLVSNTNAAGSVDTEMAAIRLALQQPRKTLSFTYQGAGYTTTITSGTGAVTDDVNAGPIPQVNSWEPIGTNVAARVRWSCTFYTSRCTAFANPTQVLLSYHDEHTFALNEDGTVRIRRTFEAIKKHSSTNGNPNFVNHIDNNRATIGIPFVLPPGFRRIKQNFTISPDGRKMTGEIVDDEEPSNNTPFKYTIKVSGEHVCGSSLLPSGTLKGAGFFSWDNTISANIQIAPGYPPALAYNIFLWILYQRMTFVDKNTNAAKSKNEKGNEIDSKPRNILTNFKVREALYHRSHSFEASYHGIYKLNDLLLQSGLFTPIYTISDTEGRRPWDDNYEPDQLREWSLWKTTVADRVLTSLGYREARLDPKSAYVIFDPCDSDYGSAAVVATTRSYGGNQDLEDTPDDTEVPPPYAGPNETYLKYHNDFQLVENTRNYPIHIQDYSDNIKRYKRTESQDISVTNTLSANAFVLNNQAGVTGSFLPDNEPRSLLGTGGGSTYTLRMQGYSIRQKFPTPCPSIVAFAGVPVERIGEPVYASKQLSEGREPLYATRWQIDYFIPREVVGNVFANIAGNPFITDKFET